VTGHDVRLTKGEGEGVDDALHGIRAGGAADGVRVFVSYRRDDVPDATDRLAQSLIAHLGKDQVFLDVDNIDIGARFAKVVGDWVGRCDVLLAVIGRGWLTATDDEGKRRLDDPRDYVRLEIEAGLERDIRVVPVLVHGARIPKAAELPDTLVPLLDFNAIELSRAYWDFDMEKLVAALQRLAVGTAGEVAERGRVDQAVADQVAAEPEQAGADGSQGEFRGSAPRSDERVSVAEITHPGKKVVEGEKRAHDISQREPARRRSPLLLGVAGAVGAVILAVAAAVVLSTGGGGGAIIVGRGPDAIAIGQGGVWVANSGDGTVLRIDSSTNKVVGSAKVGHGPAAIAVGQGGVWVANALDGTVSRLDASTGTVIGAAITVGSHPDAIAVGQGGVWVANYTDDTVSRIDSTTGKVIGSTRVGNGPDAIAVGPSAVWVANYADNTVSRIDPTTGKVVRSTKVGNGPDAIAVGQSAVWVANHGDNTVSRIDPRTGAVIGNPIRVGTAPDSIAVGPSAVWVANATSNTVSHIDSGTGAVVGDAVKVGHSPQAVAVGRGCFWVANHSDNTVSRINTVARTNHR
jgi:YVTN family beta-propeller protein